MLRKEYIRLSTLSYTISILIVKKSNNKLRLYINYRALNALTIPNKNVLSLIKEILINLYAIKIYSKFNTIVAFNKIRVKKSYEDKIVFLTNYELYEYIIIPFELYNILATF